MSHLSTRVVYFRTDEVGLGALDLLSIRGKEIPLSQKKKSSKCSCLYISFLMFQNCFVVSALCSVGFETGPKKFAFCYNFRIKVESGTNDVKRQKKKKK